MATNLGCFTTEYYTANGTDTDFLFRFEIIEETDLFVAVYNTQTKEYDNVTNWTHPDSTNIVRFDSAPSAGTKILIYRLTDINAMKAIFSPGHPIRAEDLNDNFEQLQFAIQDARCMSGSGSDLSYSDIVEIINDILNDIINNIDFEDEVIGSIQDELENINDRIDDLEDEIDNLELEGLDSLVAFKPLTKTNNPLTDKVDLKFEINSLAFLS